jgi:hypothetical protein
MSAICVVVSYAVRGLEMGRSEAQVLCSVYDSWAQKLF